MNTVMLMPDFMDPMKLLGYFGVWALVGLLVVVFVESGVLFPVLPGDSLLFVAGMLAAGTAAQDEAVNANFALWQLLVFIPIAAVAGGQVGYWLGNFAIVQKLLEPILVLIVLASVTPMLIEWYKRRRVAKASAQPVE